MDQNRVIGANGRLPWHLPRELKHFREITMGKPIVMGRKTHESIGQVLPGRRNIVVSRSHGYRAGELEVATSLGAALRLCDGSPEVMIIGGAELYATALPLCKKIHLSEILHAFAGDTYFPPLDPRQWREVAREHHPADKKNPFGVNFVELARI